MPIDKKINADFETYSEIDLKVVGAHRYAMDPTTEVLCLSYAFEGEEPKLWTPDDLPPVELFDALKSGSLFYAWNAGFENAIWRYVCVKKLGWPELPFLQLRDTQAIAANFALSSDLEKCGEALDVPVKKDKRGKTLIQRLCKPQKPTKKNPHKRWTKDTHPEMYQELYEYCKDDVRSERAILETLPWELQGLELDIWRETIIKNQRGLPIDVDLVENIIEKLDDYISDVAEMVPVITGGAVQTINQGAKIIEWCAEQGYTIPNFTAGTISDSLSDPVIDNYPEVKSIFEIRSLIGKSAIKKYSKIQQAVCPDNRIRDNLRYHKATTGREGGALMQPHNMSTAEIGGGSVEEIEKAVTLFKNAPLSDILIEYEDIIQTASALIRPSIRAPWGKKFIVSDYKSIELRVVCWLAGQENVLQMLLNGECPYTDMASHIFSTPHDQIKKGGKEYKLGKAAVLGGTYGMGISTFRINCEMRGMNITHSEAETTINTFREVYSEVKRMWYALNNRAKKATQNVGNDYSYGSITFIHMYGYLFMILPNGKRIAYPNAKIEKVKAPWGDMIDAVTHDGFISGTQKWGRSSLSPGRVAENASQATAREIIMEAKLDLERENYPVILTVHDEVVCEVDENFGSLEEVNTILCDRSDHFTGLPLQAEGFEGYFYRK